MKVSLPGLQAIMHREGFETVGYLDTRGIPTNGVGHAATGGPPAVWVGQGWTVDQVLAVLALDIAKSEANVQSVIKRPMTQNQFDAFCSVDFNIGDGGFDGSSMVHFFNAGDVQACADAFLMWEKPPVLKSRREGERAQFLRPDDPSQPAPVSAPPSAPLMSIQEIQAALNTHGAKIDVDGDLGPQTIAAIKAFQAAHGLVADGIAGRATQAALRG